MKQNKSRQKFHTTFIPWITGERLGENILLLSLLFLPTYQVFESRLKIFYNSIDAKFRGGEIPSISADSWLCGLRSRVFLRSRERTGELGV